MAVGKGILELFFHPERRPGSTGYRRIRFQKLGVMDEAEGAVVVFQFFAVQVVVIAAGFAGYDGLVVFQKVVSIPHADGQEEDQEQAKTPYKTICRLPQHF